MRLPGFCIALIFVPAVLVGQKISEPEREILTLQDQRSLGDGKLLAYLSNPDPQIRSRALIALANIQDTTTAAPAASLLNDGNAGVRGAAAFALGQIGVSRFEDTLLDRMGRENDSTALARIFEALGKIGDEKALEQVIEFRVADKNAYLKAEQALSVARFAIRGFKDERSIWFCFDLLSEPSAEVRSGALYALWRSTPHGLIDVEIAKRDSVLSALADDPSVDVRVNALTLLGRSKSDYASDLVRTFQKADSRNPNWQVEVQLVRTMAALTGSEPGFFDDLIGYLSAPDDGVKIVTLQLFSGFSQRVVSANADTARLRQELLKLAMTKNPSAELTRGEAFVAMARMFPDDFSKRDFLSDKGLSVRERTKVIEALSLVPSGRSFSIIIHALDDPEVRVAMAAWDFVRRFLTPSTIDKIRSGNQEWGDARSLMYRKTINALGRKDMAITHLVSNALADTAYFGIFRGGKYADSLVLALKSAFAILSSPDDVEAMQAGALAMGEIGDSTFVPTLENALNDPDKTVVASAAYALHEITGKDYSSRIPQSTKALHTDYDWGTLESLGPSAKAILITNKGTITLQLRRDDAPFTVLSFVKLVRKHFYDGLTFHRVVQNFVIQGGDPRGDGWGGPGYAIRSEISLARFDRGAVGIASAGKDTEGCQFFITQLPAPQLDGRYTVFANVTSGQDVVGRIQVGDTIESITIE